MDYTNLTSIQKDALREIGNIGAGNAATSMSELLNETVDMQIPAVSIVSYDEMMELIGGPDEIIVAVFFRIQGEAQGTIYFILSMEDAEQLVSKMTKDTDVNLLNADSLNVFKSSVLQESANILTGSYLSALSDFTNINMQPSIPYLSVDMAAAILTVGLIEASHVSDHSIIIDTKIKHDGSINGIHGSFLLLPDPGSFPKIFNALGIDHYV